MNNNEERELLETYALTRTECERLTEALSEANKQLEEAIQKLHECLEARQATKTAVYEGIGSYAMKEPRVIASCKAENQEALFDYLKSIGREDLIKPSVHWQTLSSFVKEIYEENKAVPEFISVYLKPSGVFYKEK